MKMLNWYPGQTLATIEREAITQALRYYGANNAMVARSLGVSERTIYDRIKEYRLQDEVIELRNKRSKAESEALLKLERGQITPVQYRKLMGLPPSETDIELNARPLHPVGRPVDTSVSAEGDTIEGLEDEIPTPEAESMHA
jgi:transposase